MQAIHCGSGFQNFVETILDFVAQQVKDTFPGHNPLIAPLALTIFLWVWLMNFMDLIPVDLLPVIASWFGIGYLKVVPTTDLSTTMAMSLTVFALIVYYNIKIKGPVGYLKMFLFHPFGKFVVPVNIVMTILILLVLFYTISSGARFGVVDFPLIGYHVTGIHFHGLDHRLFRHGPYQ